MGSINSIPEGGGATNLFIKSLGCIMVMVRVYSSIIVCAKNKDNISLLKTPRNMMAQIAEMRRMDWAEIGLLDKTCILIGVGHSGLGWALIGHFVTSRAGLS